MRRNQVDQLVQAERNEITNPKMQNVSPGTDVLVSNYAANGNFVGTTHYTGSMGGSPASWTSVTFATDKAHSGTRSFKLENCTVAGQAARKAMTNPAGVLKVLKGNKVSWSLWVYSTIAGNINPYWEGRKVSDNSYTGGGSASVFVPANTWTYVSGTSTLNIDSYVDGAGAYGLAVNVGDSVWFDDYCITATDTPLPYFDGDTPAADGYAYSWTGTANASASQRKAMASVVRTNLVANPSFRTTNGLANIRTNLLSNPSFETASGTTDVWTNNVMNPSFRATSGTVTTKTNHITNPSFEVSTSTTDVWTNLVTNPSFEAAGNTLNVRTNLVSNPSFEGTSTVSTARTNLSTNPRGISAFADYSGAGNQTITANVAITGHPEGITTANRVAYTTGANPGVTLFNPAVVGTTYTLSAWVYHESIMSSPGTQGFAQAGVISMSNPPTITVGVWQRFSWTYTATGTSQLGFRVSSNGGTGNGSFLITGVMVETVNSVLPFFDGSTPMAARVNWVSDPRATSTSVANNKLGWRTSRWFGGGSGAGTYSLITGAGDGTNGITTYLRKTWTATGNSNGDTGFDHGFGGLNGLPIMPNTYYTASSYIRANGAGKTNAGMHIIFYDGTGAQIQSTTGTLLSLTSGVWTRISHTALAPATAAYMLCISDVDSGTLWAPGESLDGTGLMVEQGGLANFFDGYNSAREGYTFAWRGTAGSSTSYATDGDYTYAWTGTANSSTSQLKITGATNTPAINTRTFAHQSSSWYSTGIKSLRITAFDSTSLDSFGILEADTGGMRLGMVAGKTYTISGTIRLVAEQTGTPSATRARRIVLFYNQNNGAYQEVASNQPANSVGYERVKLTFTLPSDTTEAFVRLYNGANAGDVWWDDVIVEEGTTSGEYFDGSNPLINLCTNGDFETNTTGWIAENGATLTRDSYSLLGGGNYSAKLSGAGGDAYFTAQAVKGATYTFSILYKTAGTLTGNPRITLQAGSSGTVTTQLPLTQLSPGRFSVTLTAPSSGYMFAAVFNGTGASDYLHFDNVLIEQSSAANAYYSGSGDYTYAWQGTANASLSFQQAPTAASVIGGNAKVVQSSVWSKGGGKSAKLIPMDVSGSNATSAQIPVTLVAGKTYTVLATRYIDKPITGTLNSSYAGRVALIQPGLSTLASDTILPNTAGEGTIRWTFTVDPAATGQTLRIGHGGIVNSGEVWWDRVLVVEGTYTGNYFDGTVPAFENLVKTTALPTNGLTHTTGVSFGGQTWTRASVPINNSGGMSRQMVALADLQQGERYTVSVTVANDQFTAQNIQLDWADTGHTAYTIQPGETRRISIYSTRTNYDTVYRFADLDVTSSATEVRSILYKDWLIEKGPSSGDYYATTGDFTYVWSGTANASTSIQRAPSVQNWASATWGVPYQSAFPAKVGTRCGAVITKGNYGDGIYFADITVAAGTSYTSSIWVKATSAHNFTGVLRFKDAAGSILSDITSDVTASLVIGSWVRVSVTGVAPTNATKLQVLWRVYATHTPATFYLDGALVIDSPVDSPYFDGATPITQNLCSNPSFESTLGTWSNVSGGSVTRDTTQGYNGTSCAKIAVNAFGSGAYYPGGAGAVKPGDVVTASAWVKGPAGQQLRFDVDTSMGTVGGWQVHNTVSPITFTGAWQRVSSTVTIPASVELVTVGFKAQTAFTGDILVDAILLEKSGTLNPYFEGTGDHTYAWTGTANASTSVQRGTGVVGNSASKGGPPTYNNAQFFTYQSTDDTGKKIARWHSPAGTANSGWRVININSNSLNWSSIVAGSTYTLLFKYRSSGWGAGQTFDTSLRDPGAQNVVIGNDTARALNTGWTEYRRTFTALISGLASTVLYISLPVTPQTATDGTFDISEWALVPGSYTGAFFDGTSVSSSADLTYAWTGTADASTSVLRGNWVANVENSNFGDNNAKPITSTEWTASTGKSMRIIPVGTQSDTSAMIAGNASSGTGVMVPGKTYTVKATFRQSAPQTGTLHARARGIMFADSVTGWASAPVVAATNTAGSQTLTHTFTVPAAATWATVRLYNGATGGNGDVWWDDVVMVEGGYTDGYFDGSTTAAGDFSYAWAGTANASQSYQKATSVDHHSVEAKLITYVTTSGTFKSIVKDPNGGGGRSFVPRSAPGVNMTMTAGKAYTIKLRAKKLSTNTTLRLAGGISQLVPLTTSMADYTYTLTPSIDSVLYMELGSGVNDAGIELENLMVVEGAYTGPYFDGNTSGTSSLMRRWTGTADASTSQEIGAITAGFTDEPNIKHYKLEDGAMRVVNIAGTTHSLQTMTGTLESGKRHTVLIRAKSYNGGQMRIYGLQEAPLVSLTSSYDWYRVIGTASDVRLYLSTQGGIGGAGFDISHMLVAKGRYDGNYFDGDYPLAKWAGSINNSISIGYAF